MGGAERTGVAPAARIVRDPPEMASASGRSAYCGGIVLLRFPAPATTCVVFIGRGSGAGVRPPLWYPLHIAKRIRAQGIAVSGKGRSKRKAGGEVGAMGRKSGGKGEGNWEENGEENGGNSRKCEENVRKMGCPRSGSMIISAAPDRTALLAVGPMDAVAIGIAPWHNKRVCVGRRDHLCAASGALHSEACPIYRAGSYRES